MKEVYLQSRLRPELAHCVYFTPDLLASHFELWIKELKNFSQPVALLLDQGLLEAQPELLGLLKKLFSAHLPQLKVHFWTLLGGESCKNDPQLLFDLYQRLSDQHFCKQSLLIAIGGGAFLDFTGFVAATYHRGCRYWRVPTTTLSLADSGVGVKNSLNFGGHKNAIGVHHVPEYIFLDPSFLYSLDTRNWNAGFSEALKIALLSSEKDFHTFKANLPQLLARDPKVAESTLCCSATLHFKHIGNSSDPLETRQSRPLDFGHWAAHRLEVLSNYEVLHGEAVSVGIALDCIYSHLLGELSKQNLDSILHCTRELCKNTPLSPLLFKLSPEEIIIGLEDFRQHLGGQLCITLLKAPANPFEVSSIDMDLMIQALKNLPSLLFEP